MGTVSITWLSFIQLNDNEKWDRCQFLTNLSQNIRKSIPKDTIYRDKALAFLCSCPQTSLTILEYTDSLRPFEMHVASVLSNATNNLIQRFCIRNKSKLNVCTHLASNEKKIHSNQCIFVVNRYEMTLAFLRSCFHRPGLYLT